MSQLINELTNKQVVTNLGQGRSRNEASCTALASDIRIAALADPATLLGRLVEAFGPILDWLLGIKGIRSVYEKAGVSGADALSFIKGVLAELRVNVTCAGISEIPRSGPVLVVCNHPYGGLEALIVAKELLDIRHDVKVLGNSALKLFTELHDLCIFINPLVKSQKNLPAIREALAQLEAGGVLLIFPAGRVSYHQSAKNRITDHEWNRIVGHLVKSSDCCVMPLFVSGTNSRLFHLLGRLYYRLKLLMLPREMLKIRSKSVQVSFGKAVPNTVFRNVDSRQTTLLTRLLSYLQDTSTTTTPHKQMVHARLGLATDTTAITAELASLPPEQIVERYQQFVVAFGYQAQLPNVVKEITRQRERTFRLFAEGSGQPYDTDAFDQNYVHVFVWDEDAREIVGAYRMGETDQIRASQGIQGIYLSRMFEFQDNFFSQGGSKLELGRSFVTPEHQRRPYALRLLWRGIGGFLQHHPEYEHLYGTVSLSQLYDPRSVGIMCSSLIESTPLVTPKFPLCIDLGPEWSDFRQSNHPVSMKLLSALVEGIEGGTHSVPVLLRHYHKLGAKFLSVGVDPNFNDTPGLLLSVHIPSIPGNIRKRFMSNRRGDAYI